MEAITAPAPTRATDRIMVVATVAVRIIRPYYGGYPGSVTVEVGDRPYYRHGAGYYVGRTYYVWKPGHWAARHGQRVWIHGHYVVRGGY